MAVCSLCLKVTDKKMRKYDGYRHCVYIPVHTQWRVSTVFREHRETNIVGRGRDGKREEEEERDRETERDRGRERDRQPETETARDRLKLRFGFIK